MPDEAFTWMGNIKAVEREYRAIRLAADHLLRAIDDDPATLQGTIGRPDIRTASNRLEGTYVIRVFAEFETALQEFLRAFHLARPRTTEQLVNKVRDRGHIPQGDADAVHRVRDFRNALVHNRFQAANPVSIRDATRALCIFLSRIQRIW